LHGHAPTQFFLGQSNEVINIRRVNWSLQEKCPISPQHHAHLVKGHLKITVTVPLVLPTGLSERPVGNYKVFFPNFLTFTLGPPIFTFEKTTEESKTRKKKKIINNNIFLPIMFKEENTFLSKTQGGTHSTYVTVANQSTVHGTSPPRKKKYNISKPPHRGRLKYSCCTSK